MFVQTRGEQPMACSSHAMTYTNGEKKRGLSQCKVLDISTLTWYNIATNQSKFSHASCVLKDKVNLFGGSMSIGVLCVDPQQMTITSIQSHGIAPHTTVTRISALIDGCSYTSNNETVTVIRTYDIETNVWKINPNLHDGD